MQGIYKITNLINNQSYIGVSNNIEKRFKDHKERAFLKGDKEYEKTLYRAFRKYGLENFSFEILQEENDSKKRCELEQYYIKLYDTFHNGYNETIGGDICNMQKEETHSRAKLTRQEVIDIRIAYNNLERYNVVYERYKDKIGPSGFHKIWNWETWPNVVPEYHTKENIEYHKHDTANKGSKNGMAKLTEQDVINIRTRRKNGEKLEEVYKDYSQLTLGSFKIVWYNRNWKHITV